MGSIPELRIDALLAVLIVALASIGALRVALSWSRNYVERASLRAIEAANAALTNQAGAPSAHRDTGT